MNSTVLAKLDAVQLRNAKASLEPVRKLNPDAGAVLDLARGNCRLEPKQMADAMGLSHSLVLRGLGSKDDLGFHRLWELPDSYWEELLVAVAKKRFAVRTTIDFESLKRSA